MNEYDVALWMIEQIHERRRVRDADLAREGLVRFGRAFVVTGAQHERFSDSVLAAFRRRHGGLIRWQPPYWESLREPAEGPPCASAASASPDDPDVMTMAP